MAEISLTESGLKTILSKHKIKDNGLQKALAAYEKVDDNAHDDCIACLEQIDKLGTAFKKVKEVSANKDVSKYVDNVLDAAADKIKEATKAKAASAKTAAADKAEQKKKEDDAKKKGEDEGEEDEEEEGAYSDRLMSAFKKLKTMNGKAFEFIVCDARPLPSIMVAKRVTPKHKEELTELSGGCRKFSKKGSCFFADEHYVLELDPAMPGLARKVQKAVKNHTGKKLKFSHGGETAGDDDEEKEQEQGEAEAPEESAQQTGQPGEKTPEKNPLAPPPSSGAGAPPIKGGATAPDAHIRGQPNPEEEVLEDRRRIFKKARAAWVAVKAKAEQDLEKVKDGARIHYLADAEQFPKVEKGCKDIDAILDHLDDDLRDTLNLYASTPLKNQAKLTELATTAKGILDRYQKFVADNAILKAIDEKEFADVTIHAPIMKALADLRKALA